MAIRGRLLWHIRTEEGRYWVEIDKKYHRLFNDPSMEDDYWEDLDDYIGAQADEKLTERIYKKLSQIEAVKEYIQEKGKVIELNKRIS